MSPREKAATAGARQEGKAAFAACSGAFRHVAPASPRRGNCGSVQRPARVGARERVGFKKQLPLVGTCHYEVWKVPSCLMRSSAPPDRPAAGDWCQRFGLPVPMLRCRVAVGRRKEGMAALRAWLGAFLRACGAAIATACDRWLWSIRAGCDGGRGGICRSRCRKLFWMR